MIHTRNMCKHCGLPGLRSGAAWCKRCTEQARNNHSVCGFCNKDITEYSACYQVARRLDDALLANDIPTWSCPSCKKHNDEWVELAIQNVHVEAHKRYLRMECPVCHTAVETRVVMFRPPPKDLGPYT
jgi:hypothetical protein